jgi:hypothetical protein
MTSCCVQEKVDFDQGSEEIFQAQFKQLRSLLVSLSRGQRGLFLVLPPLTPQCGEIYLTIYLQWICVVSYNKHARRVSNRHIAGTACLRAAPRDPVSYYYFLLYYYYYTTRHPLIMSRAISAYSSY